MIKNYTSSVSATKSVNHIEDKLVAYGAKNILKLYENKKLAGIAFILILNDKEIPFRIPARIGNVERLLKAQIKRPRSETYKNIAVQAERTAWKLLADWVEIQISLVELQQVKFLEVFLPYVYDHAKQQTFFEKLEENNFKQLLYNE
ncbi:hypothetical protein KAR91_48650 [Candidatus Pacearchaeota archaeon]|nr:hypothetical protein [Candidatus Pacearchaeota archaeon]